MKKSFKLFTFVGLFLVVWIQLFSTFIPIYNLVFPFTFDQARDAIWVKNQFDFQQPTLIGPWGSLSGVFFGPGWFWLLGIPYFIFGGDPASYVFLNAVIIFGTVFMAAMLIYKHNLKISYFIIILGFLSQAISGIAGYAFSQHLLLPLTLTTVFSYAKFLNNHKIRYFTLAVFSISLMFHAEPATAFFSLPSIAAIILSVRSKKTIFNIKNALFILCAFLIPLVPQIIFDFKHDFIELRAVINFFCWANHSLGDILPFWSRLIDRPLKFFEVFKLTSVNHPLLAFIVMSLACYYSLFRLKNYFEKDLVRSSYIYLITLLLGFLVFPPDLKGFYLDGLAIVYILMLSVVLGNLWNNGSIGKIIVSVFIALTVTLNIDRTKLLNIINSDYGNSLKNGSVFRNLARQVDWIYNDARGNGFAVYTYDPAIYDFPFQYMFLWYGLKTYGYLPNEFSYLPNVPEYVQKKRYVYSKNK